MGLSVGIPTKHLAFLLVLMAFQFLAFGGSLESAQTLTEPVATPDSFTDLDGMGQFILDVGNKEIALVTFMFELATFSAVEGIPNWVQIPLVAYVSTIWALLGVAILTPLLDALGNLIPLT